MLRQKRTCFGCRAVKATSSGAACALGFKITTPDGQFYRPARGQLCPKPSTFDRLQAASRSDHFGGGVS